MLFQSWQYLLLLGASLALVFVAPRASRWPILLGASYLFYGDWRADYLLLLIASTLIDYGCGLGLSNLPDGRRRLAVLSAALAANLSILGYFKYRLFFAETVGAFAPAVDLDLWRASEFILPAGLSFYTLQSMAYSIDVYRRRIPIERHLGWFALYVAYFPQLIAGPIERAGHLLPQLRACPPFDWNDIRIGGLLFLFGLFKKLVVADHLAPVIAALYADPAGASASQVLLILVLSPVFILMDFSAYTDMARGSARMMGIDLAENFRMPLASRSIRDFWRRWHITLSTWVFDYLYGPLARRSRRLPWRMAALLFSFAAIGLWHGPSWTFVLFGLFHGTAAVAETLAARFGWTWPGGRRWDVLRWARTYLLASLSTLLFLSPDLSTVRAVLARLDGSIALGMPSVQLSNLLLTLSCGAFAGMIHLLRERMPVAERVIAWPLALRWFTYYALIGVILIFGVDRAQAFVYFQF